MATSVVGGVALASNNGSASGSIITTESLFSRRLADSASCLPIGRACVSNNFVLPLVSETS